MPSRAQAWAAQLSRHDPAGLRQPSRLGQAPEWRRAGLAAQHRSRRRSGAMKPPSCAWTKAGLLCLPLLLSCVSPSAAHSAKPAADAQGLPGCAPLCSPAHRSETLPLHCPGPAEALSVVWQFQQAVLDLPSGGLPSATEAEPLRAWLSPRLWGLLMAARAAQDRITADQGNRQPPIVQGSVFHSLAEGAQRIEDVAPEPEAGQGAFRVALAYGAPAGAQPMRWHDRVWLIAEQGRWVVDEVELLGGWDFAVRGRLSQRLCEAYASHGLAC